MKLIYLLNLTDAPIDRMELANFSLSFTTTSLQWTQLITNFTAQNVIIKVHVVWNVNETHMNTVQ